MINQRTRARRSMLLCGAALAAAISAAPAMAQEQVASIDIPAQPLASALRELARQSGANVLFAPDAVRGLQAPAVQTSATPETAARQLLAGTDLAVLRDPTGALVIRSAAPQQDGAEAGGSVDALIVTAQKREENIQDVPIAISAFSQEDLTRSQIAGGPDLMTQVPNMTFTKTNFSSYSIQIRGIGTQAISATTDAAVAVAFNNTPFIRNRFFEQEFYDLQRVEVLRGPQGTLYGRNATAGVVNIISAKPVFSYEAKVSGDVANYNSTRFEGMVNVPLVEDAVALRLAAAWTKRDGFVENQITGQPVDGRDLWSTRLSLRVAPSDALDINLVWEHFEEDDDRLRSGKQVCHKHVVTEVGGLPVNYFTFLPNAGQGGTLGGVQSALSQGCVAASMYSPDSYETVNGTSVPYYVPLAALGLPVAKFDPYVSKVQSRDLRVIESTVDPQYRAKSDIAEVQVSFDLTDSLTLSSETAYSTDELFSLQDFNRFNTAHGAWGTELFQGSDFLPPHRAGVVTPGPVLYERECLQEEGTGGCLPSFGVGGGVFCDPQIGCSDRLVAMDLSTATSRQFSQEFRLSSNYEGKFNFSLGANFLRYDTEDKYYVFINSLSLYAAMALSDADVPPYVSGVSDNFNCLPRGPLPGTPGSVYPVTGCIYIDPNPIGSLNDRGHNYFLSKNPYKLISYAAFGEAYYNVTDTLKVTGGLRWTVDRKEAPRIPSWVLAAVSFGYPVAEVIEQEWREPTGRLAVDWKPDLSFTDETLFYASLAHGYKAGGANPPGYTYIAYGSADISQSASNRSATRPTTFEPEYVDAFELGAKNTLADGRVTVNLAAFYYDYTGYQVSEIVDRSAFNRNFDATVWGLEIEADWRPLENLRLGFKGGYENTRLADGSKAVDLMDRTAGREGWVVRRPFPTFASNCILPEALFVGVDDFTGEVIPVDLGGVAGGNPSGCELAYILNRDPVTDAPYVDLTGMDPSTIIQGPLSLLRYHPGYTGWDPSTAPNNGEGFDKDISGNELPNAPDFTATITVDYTIPLPADWLATLHTDLYYQSEAWTRVFNTDGYDKLKAYNNINVAAIFTNEEAGWRVMAYVKNVLDKDSITGAFLNSDDTGLTTNVFLIEPRLYGVRVTKEWNGGPLLGSFGERRDGPYPLTVEFGGQIQRHEADNEPVEPSFIDQFADALNPLADQEADLDWGDGREIKVSYQPAAWKMALSARFGDTNGASAWVTRNQLGDRACALPLVLCQADESTFQDFDNYTVSTTNEGEEHTIIDFVVGREVGVGVLDSSDLAVGLRYAELGSETSANIVGSTHWNIPVDGNALKYQGPTTHDRYKAKLAANREFRGAGLVLDWAASRRLFGDRDTGALGLEWSVSGGLLFGKQRTAITGEELAEHFSVPTASVFSFSGDYVFPTSTTPLPVDIHRSETVRVPTYGASLGLSYKVDRFSLGAGYHWERYQGAIDGGFAAAKDEDRTINGPYFKVSVGFGG